MRTSIQQLRHVGSALRCLPAHCLALCCFALVISTAVVHSANADGPSDNIPDKVRPIPPEGIAIPDETREQLLSAADELSADTDKQKNADSRDRAQVKVIARAVRMAVEDGMFYSNKEVEQTRALLKVGDERLKALASGKTGVELIGVKRSRVPQLQLVIGGFESRIDGSIQPYGLVLPAETELRASQPLRLDVWLHGRGEKTSEAAFLHQRLHSEGEISPSGAIVLHPYGRYCNAFRFAGEVDVLEAIEEVKRLFPIDENRINIRGFSMGGAGCWQMAVHYPGTWMAATPGAGFSETRQFLKIFQKQNFQPSATQSSLLHWYDCPEWSNNLRLLPTIAYSGEIDNQKQAADVMEAAMQERGLMLRHVIGPQTGHKIHPESKIEIENFLTEVSQGGRSKTPKEIDFTTYSLRYAKNSWITIEGLEEHWQEARVRASIQPGRGIDVKTQNVTALTIELPVDQPFLENSEQLLIDLDGMPIECSPEPADSPRRVHFSKASGSWRQVDAIESSRDQLRKRPGLQGPIDDAFMKKFLFVGPEAETVASKSVETWAGREFGHAKEQWRKHFRGDVNERSASELTEKDIATHNLVLFGTPESNPLIAKIIKHLPIHWQNDSVTVGSQTFGADQHVPALIYPNPLNPDRYVVLNSGFTFREFAYLNNARQIAMLPDWAVIDTSTPANAQSPGKIAAAGFFNEAWQFK